MENHPPEKQFLATHKLGLYQHIRTKKKLSMWERDDPSKCCVPCLFEMSLKWFWRGRFLIVLNVFSLCSYYLPFEKGVALYLNKLESLFSQGRFVLSLFESGAVVLKRWEIIKSVFVITCIYFQFVSFPTDMSV